MPDLFGGLTGFWRERLERQRNRPFLKAVMAACALVAVADGQVSLGQRLRMDRILETLTRLRMFDPHEGVDLFNRYVEAILVSPREGHLQAVAAIESAADDDETKQLLVRVCIAISEAGGTMGLVERIEIVSLCTLLGVDPASCGLDSDVTQPGHTGVS